MKTPWLRFFYVVASEPGASALDVDVPDWAMPQITMATHDLWIVIADADAVLLRMAVSGFGSDEGDGTFGFDLGGRFRLDEFAGTHYPHIRYRWIELCAVELETQAARAALDEALATRLLAFARLAVPAGFGASGDALPDILGLGGDDWCYPRCRVDGGGL